MNITQLDKQYVANTYNRFPVEITHGRGSECWDDAGKRYIDMGSGIGVTAFGYADEAWQAAVTAQLGKDEVAKAPGMKYRHYAPQCPLVIVSGSSEKAARFIRSQYKAGERVLCFEEELPLYQGCDPLSYGCAADVTTLSAGVFAALRVLDDPAVSKVYARCPEGGGVAYAVQNRLKKAASFHIIDAEAVE